MLIKEPTKKISKGIEPDYITKRGKFLWLLAIQH